MLDGFAGEEAARELRAELSGLYATRGAHGRASEFSRGEVGGGRDGSALVVRKDAAFRGDERALIEANDPRAPSLRGLFFLCDQLVGMLGARGIVPELAAVTRRSRPMLACYAGAGAKYIRHVDNPDGNGRLLTAIYYLNASWRAEHGGELVLFPQRTPGGIVRAAGGGGDDAPPLREVVVEPARPPRALLGDARTPPGTSRTPTVWR